MAGFKPQANLPFVGVYVAKEKGFFDALNLDVDIKHSQSGENLQLLLAGEVQVTTANAAEVAERHSEGLPLVSLALIGQKSEQGFAVGANSGINSVSDFVGKRLGYKGSVPVEFLALAKANGINPDDVDQVKVGYDPRVLSEGQVDILSVFISNEPGQLESIGYPVTVFDPSDYDIPVLGLTYVSSQDEIEQGPRGAGAVPARRNPGNRVRQCARPGGSRHRDEVRAARSAPATGVHADHGAGACLDAPDRHERVWLADA